jgi:hypothetical protein
MRSPRALVPARWQGRTSRRRLARSCWPPAGSDIRDHWSGPKAASVTGLGGDARGGLGGAGGRESKRVSGAAQLPFASMRSATRAEVAEYFSRRGWPPGMARPGLELGLLRAADVVLGG